MDLSEASLTFILLIFAAAAAVIAWAGTKLAYVADRLADKTGLGEAVVGAVLLGGCTSISGSITSATAAFNGYASLAVGNALGGIAVQTFFLALGDLFYRKANLEHAAASVPNLTYGTLLLLILGFLTLGFATPSTTVLWFHPISFIVILAYLYGLRLAKRAREAPMWGPRKTAMTKEDRPDHAAMKEETLKSVWSKFFILALVTAGAGYVVAQSGMQISQRTGLSETLVGAFMTAIITSLPELITTLAAVRSGALTLAVGGVIGGNSFDTLFFAISDFFYRDGSIFVALGNQEVYLIALTTILTSILLLGMIQREKHGFANIGFESLWVFILYLSGSLFLFLGFA